MVRALSVPGLCGDRLPEGGDQGARGEPAQRARDPAIRLPEVQGASDAGVEAKKQVGLRGVCGGELLIAGKFEVPDECPDGCVYRDSFYQMGQSAICGRCPVFCCKESEGPDGETDFALVHRDDYRPDWAEAWVKFFDTGEGPELFLVPPEKRGEVSSE